MAAPSPQLTRLDAILALVAEQEEHRREQDMRIAELTARLAEVEGHAAAEWAPLWALKERDVGRELDMARAAVESLVRQVATLNRGQQAAAADAARAAARQQQWQDEAAAALAALRSDVEALRGAVSDARAAAADAAERLQRWVEQQLRAHRDAVEEAVQSVAREARAEIGGARADLASQTAASVRQLEAWARGEVLAVAGKLKSVVASCAAQQEQVRVQFEALHQQWEGTGAAVDALRAEERRLKRHVARLERKAEEAPQLAAAETASEGALARVLARVDTAAAAAATAARRGAAAEAAAERQRLDLLALAEHVGGCLEAVPTRAHPRAPAGGAHGGASYLSTLLAPPPPALPAAGVSGSGGGGDVGAAAARAHAAWEQRLRDFDALTERLRKRLGTGRGADQRGLPIALAASPPRG